MPFLGNREREQSRTQTASAMPISADLQVVSSIGMYFVQSTDNLYHADSLLALLPPVSCSIRIGEALACIRSPTLPCFERDTKSTTAKAVCDQQYTSTSPPHSLLLNSINFLVIFVFDELARNPDRARR